MLERNLSGFAEMSHGIVIGDLSLVPHLGNDVHNFRIILDNVITTHQ